MSLRKQIQTLLSISACSVAPISAADLVYQEGFNTDGEAASPKRYTTVGRDVYEVARLRSELGNTDQLGPVYWAHNFEVSFVGVPAPTPARRMVMAWDPLITAEETNDTMMKLFESSVKWLVNNKANAKIVVGATVEGIGVLADRLTAAGYTLVADDPAVSEEQIATQGDLFIHGPGSGGSRGAAASMPVLTMISPDHDDMLVSSIGTATAFEAGKGTIVAPTHPAAGGLTGQFDVATGSHTWNLMGELLPQNATIIANFIQSVTPSVTSIGDVDAMIAGTMQSTKVTETLATLDLSDSSAGNWVDDAAVPGGVIGNWGLLATGRVAVATAGTYSFALGTDDGGRVQIDINKNGFDAGDTIINDAGPHAHTVTFGNATFPAAGSYAMRVVAYNSGGGGGLEVSVANTAGAGKNDLVAAPENWEVLGLAGAASPVKAEGTFTVTSYVAAGDVVDKTLPLIMLLNGPSDTPAGSVFGGGPFTGFEGAGFFGASGINKWTYPDDQSNRRLTLGPINVRGKTNVQITIAAAATFLDFETSDYLDLYIDPDDSGPAPFQQLIHFAAPTGNDKYFDDRGTSPQNPTRLGLSFKDVTYNVPPGATDLVIEMRAATTFWNEIAAFDNIRVTAGAAGGTGTPTISIAKQGANPVITFSNGTLQRTTDIKSPSSATQWTDVTASGTYSVIPGDQGARAFFRVRQ